MHASRHQLVYHLAWHLASCFPATRKDEITKDTIASSVKDFESYLEFEHNGPPQDARLRWPLVTCQATMDTIMNVPHYNSVAIAVYKEGYLRI